MESEQYRWHEAGQTNVVLNLWLSVYHRFKTDIWNPFQRWVQNVCRRLVEAKRVQIIWSHPQAGGAVVRVPSPPQQKARRNWSCELLKCIHNQCVSMWSLLASPDSVFKLILEDNWSGASLEPDISQLRSSKEFWNCWFVGVGWHYSHRPHWRSCLLRTVYSSCTSSRRGSRTFRSSISCNNGFSANSMGCKSRPHRTPLVDLYFECEIVNSM